MRTDDLIRTLAADDAPSGPRPRLALVAAIALGWPLSGLMFVLLLGPRPDIAAVATDPRFLLKFAVALLLAATAAGLALRLVRPGRSAAAFVLAAAPAVLAAGVAAELAIVPHAQWAARLVGTNALVCLTLVPLLSVPLLALLLLGMRAGASPRPAMAGAVAGLIAGGLAAALYAAHCPDDSPLFVATWYTLAIAVVAAAGALAGRRLLRW
jgi:hypothetical protein